MSASKSAVALTQLAAKISSDKLAENIVALDVSEHLVITDVFLIASASSDRQVNAIVDAIEAALDLEDIDPIRREGNREGKWVLLDYFDVVVHVQQNEERSLYDLERLWSDCPQIPLELV